MRKERWMSEQLAPLSARVLLKISIGFHPGDVLNLTK